MRPDLSAAARGAHTSPYRSRSSLSERIAWSAIAAHDTNPKLARKLMLVKV
jgi:hypothetical protein